MLLKFLRRLQYIIKLRIYKKNGIIIGENTFISHKAYIDKHSNASIKIGNNCYITRNVIILNHTDTHMGGPLGLWKEFGSQRISKDVTIGDNVFIGVQTVIMPGVKIGNNSIIGALSLITFDVPSNTIVGGIPARLLGSVPEMLSKDFPNFNIEEWKKRFGEI